MKKVIGITGGIASGKTNVSCLARKKGYLVIDADEISRKLSQKNEAIYLKIVSTFGPLYLNEDQSLNRDLLGKLVFHDPEARKKLNEISHPLIVEEIRKQLEASSDELIFVDIPLLYEANLAFLCDEIICCYIPYQLQLKRLMERDQITECYAKSKIDSQMSLEKKKEMADFVIDTSYDFSNTENQLNQIIRKIKGEENGNI